MNKHSKDYIPYRHEIELEREERRARIKGKIDPRKEYKISFTWHGQTFTETYLGRNSNEVIDILKREYSLIGWFPQNIIAVEVPGEVKYLG